MKIRGGMMKCSIDAFMTVYTDSMKGTIDDGMCDVVFRLSVPSVLIRRGTFHYVIFSDFSYILSLIAPFIAMSASESPASPP